MIRKMFRVDKSSPSFWLCSSKKSRRIQLRGTSFLGALALVMAWGLPSVSEGAGFALVQQGTGAMAQGNAFVAKADDPSAIFYNPAGLNQLKRPQVYLGTFINYPNREYHGSGGGFFGNPPPLL